MAQQESWEVLATGLTLEEAARELEIYRAYGREDVVVSDDSVDGLKRLQRPIEPGSLSEIERYERYLEAHDDACPRNCAKCGCQKFRFQRASDGFDKRCLKCGDVSELTEADESDAPTFLRRDPTWDDVTSLCSALGFERSGAQDVVTANPELARRMLRAYDAQWAGKRRDMKFRITNAGLYDPIEDDPLYRDALQKVRSEVNARAAGDGELEFGRCHRTWFAIKREVQKQLGIEWFSPSEMNPHSDYD